MIPPSFDLDRALADVHVLVQEIGPRVAGSPAEQMAATYARTQLIAAGWQPTDIAGGVLACRGTGRTLFLAHLDSVPKSPGAVDNAGAVAVLLELARTSKSDDLCLGFPLAEEIGLVGSKKMVHAWADSPHPWPQRVVSVDMIGDGIPTAIDLTRDWGHRRLDWLVTAAPDLDIPYLHHAFGRALPQWRSDHAPFARIGAPTFLINTRGEHGVFTRYHQPSDTTVDPNSLALTAGVLEGIANAPDLPPSDAQPSMAVRSMVLPGWLCWGLLGAGWISGAADLPRVIETWGTIWRGILAAIAATLVMAICLIFPWPVDPAETAALAGARPGWWRAAPVVLACGGLVWGLLRWRMGGKGSAPLLAGLLSGVMTLMDPLWGLPMAAAALLARIHPVLALAPLPLLLRAAAVRELTFHGLVYPIEWGAIFLLAIPAFGARPKKR